MLDLDKMEQRAKKYDLAGHVLLLIARVRELEATFDLRWKATMRAINRWQQATGKDMTWPDHADLCVWLLDQIDQRVAAERKRCASIARNGCLVPPDGGSPTEDEREMCEGIAKAIELGPEYRLTLLP